MTDRETNIADRVRRIVAVHQGVAEDEITDDRRCFQNLDSMDIEELIMAFEDEFCIRIPDGDAAGFHTVGDAIRYLEDRGKQAAKNTIAEPEKK